MPVLAACTRQEMDNQPKYEAYEPAPRFPDDQAVRPRLPGTVPRGSYRARPPRDNPVKITPRVLERGRSMFQAYCSPCHGLAGYGEGMIVQRGYPSPPSYHIPRLRAVSDRYIFNVITHGYGIMYSYANRVRVPDRWAIVAYIRALQLSQWADASALPPAVQASLEERRGEQDRLLPARAREVAPGRPPLPAGVEQFKAPQRDFGKPIGAGLENLP
ncbi:MAG: cytochrome c [Candidatus Competibacteraceae bacterium]|nr:cytochrome c [Candidatus Competibacteraceae bacterium]